MAAAPPKMMPFEPDLDKASNTGFVIGKRGGVRLDIASNRKIDDDSSAVEPQIDKRG
jgi:hypothetical protein